MSEFASLCSAPQGGASIERISEGMKLEVLDDANPYHVWTATVSPAEQEGWGSRAAGQQGTGTLIGDGTAGAGRSSGGTMGQVGSGMPGWLVGWLGTGRHGQTAAGLLESCEARSVLWDVRMSSSA